MTKAQAKRSVYRAVHTLLDAGHLNTFLLEDIHGNTLSDKDEDRMRIAMKEIRDEMARRGRERKNNTAVTKGPTS